MYGRGIYYFEYYSDHFYVYWNQCLEVIGLPILFVEQNSPLFILVIFEVVILVIAAIIIYLRIEKKYRQQ